MIVTDEKQLRIECEAVKPEEVDDLRAKLEDELKKSARRGKPGIGVAAPQIGISKKMAIVRIGNDHKIDLVNPEILESYDEATFDGEGCLQFPGKSVTTRRFREIVVSTDVEPFKFVATDLFAVCVQHEIDHLNGILLLDREIK